LAVGAAGVMAFTPMFVFVSAAVNNDNLAILLASASVLLIARMGARSTEKWTLHSLQYPRRSLRWEWGAVRGHISSSHLSLGVLLGLGVAWG